MATASPTVDAHCVAVCGPAPRFEKKSTRSGLESAQSEPFEKPSNDVVPIAAHSNATAPGINGICGAPDRGRRRYRTPSSRSHTDSRLRSSKYTPKASPRRLHVSAP